jgi:ABC-2 type transport system permease protein
MTAADFRMDLRRSRSLTAWLAVLLAGYGVIMAFMYPIMVDNDELFRQYMQTFPEQFLVAFGMTGSLGDPGVFFTTYVSSWLWPIMAAIAAILGGTRVAADLDRGFLDLPLATPLSRTRHLVLSILGQALVIAILAAATVGSIWAGGLMVDVQFDLARFAAAGVLAWLFGCALAGVATLLAVLTLSRGRTAGIVSGVLVAMYLAWVVAQVSLDWEWLLGWSAWGHFNTTVLIDDGTLPAGDLALFAVIALAGWGAAVIAFARRDLAA